MMDNMIQYREMMMNELDKATKEFEAAKEKAAREIMSIEWNTAEFYGAGYASKIEDITKAASRMKALGEAIKAFDHYMKAEK